MLHIIIIMNKQIKLTAKDISEIYSKETIYPKWLAFLFWYIILSIAFVGKGGRNEKKKE